MHHTYGHHQRHLFWYLNPVGTKSNLVTPLGVMEATNDHFGALSNSEAELIDKVMLLQDSDADCNYLNLIADCISEISKTEEAEKCSVEVISESCKVHKFYSETSETVVKNHFTRSLPASSLNFMEDDTNKKAPVRKTGAAKRKAKRKPTVTSLMPSRAHVTTDARVHPYTFIQPACRPQSSATHRVEMYSGAYYVAPLPQYCVQYQRFSHENGNDFKPPVYKAFRKGNTLIEVYSPTVGRGFNPRYNSLLIEPTVQAFLPTITGLNTTMSAIMADMHTFHHMAIEFNIPS